MYCFGSTAHESGQVQAKLDVMMQISGNDASQNVERTSVPQECSEFQRMQYNVLLWGENPLIRPKSSKT
jgi:hypothetical protein